MFDIAKISIFVYMLQIKFCCLSCSKGMIRLKTGARSESRTREKLLECAFEEMHRNGFQGLRVDTLLKKTGLTKGAFYHYFPSKKALGYAVVDEIISRMMNDLWLQPLVDGDDPIEIIGTALSRKAEILGDDFLLLGCPLNNLAQEMSPVDEGFRERLEWIFQTWNAVIAGALEVGQKQGRIRRDIDPQEVATFIIAALEGSFSLAKNAQSTKAMFAGERQLQRYLETLRA